MLRFCSCRACKAGKQCEKGKETIRLVVRAFRHKTKQQLKQGETEPPKKASVPYLG